MKKNRFVIKNPPGGVFEEVRFVCRKGKKETPAESLQEEARRIIAEYGLPAKEKCPEKSVFYALRWYFWGMGSCGGLFLLTALVLKWLA